MAARNKELVSLRGDRDSGKETRRGPRLRDYLRPWAAIPVLVPAGYLTHWMWGDMGWGTGLAAAGILAAGSIVTYATHALTTARTWYAHHIAIGMTGTSTAWLTLATAAGPGRPVLDILLLGGATLAAIANVHLWAGGQTSNEQQQKGTGRILPSFARVAEVLNLKNIRARMLSDTDMQQRHKLHLDNGETVEGIQHRRKELASAYGVAPGAIRIVESTSRADEAELIITKKEVMGELIPWPGLNPEHVGTSIADHPLHLGTYEDGEPFFNEVTNRHSLTVGMAGAGKSVYGKAKLVQIAARSDTFCLAIDLAKGEQTLGPIQAAIGWSAYNKKSAKALLAAVKVATKARANHLAKQGKGQWTKGCGLTFLYILVEEAAETVDFAEIVDTARVARSVGIQLELSLQRATHGNLDTDARANLGDGICFGVRDEADASYALPDYVLEAGCDPSRWRKSRPGAFYAAVEAAPQERHTVAIKAFGPPTTNPDEENAVLTPAAESLPSQDEKLDPVTRAAFGKAYEAYLQGVDLEDLEETDDEDDVDELEDEEPMDTDAQEHDEIDPIVLSTPDGDPEITGDIDTEIPPLDGDDFALVTRARKGTVTSAAEARAAVDSLIDEWGTGYEFTPYELKVELREMGVERKKSWIYSQTKRLADEGRITQDDTGTWRVQETRALAGV